MERITKSVGKNAEVAKQKMVVARSELVIQFYMLM